MSRASDGVWPQDHGIERVPRKPLDSAGARARLGASGIVHAPWRCGREWPQAQSARVDAKLRFARNKATYRQHH